MEAVRFKTENFEGPLDLLLHLISKNKMKLYDIKITELIDQYLAVVGTIGPDELDEASEFVEMAARLVYLKSVALLPKSEEAVQLERELAGQLIEYSLCKQAARKLASMREGVWYYVRDPQKPDADIKFEYNVKHGAAQLVAALEAMSLKNYRKREPDAQELASRIAPARVSVPTRIVYILKGLRSGTIDDIGGMFRNSRSISEAVATFLALLELIKAGRVAVDGEGDARILKKEKVL